MKPNYFLMKKTIFITLLLTSVLLLSCSKKNDPANDDLNGTIWKTNNIGTVAAPEYRKLNFTANSAYYEYVMLPNSSEFLMTGGGFYAIKGNQITLTSITISTGTINGSTLNIVIDGVSMIFTKQ